MSDYQEALEAAGCKVIAFKEFGSYQGEWLAKVEVSGKELWVSGSYGSCSGCDAFQGEFGYDLNPWCDAHSYHENKDCLGCQAKRAAYQQKLASFGKPYVEGGVDQEAALTEASRNLEWDSDAAEMVAFIKANPLKASA